jgi:hypothetical protein
MTPKAVRLLYLAVGLVLAVTGIFLASGPLSGAHSGGESASGGRGSSGTVDEGARPTANRDPAKDPADHDAASYDQAGAGLPSRIDIPRLRVSAPVQNISMSNDPDDPKYRTLVPPDDPDTVGWWRDGPKPGAGVGTALIVGHTLKKPGVEGIGGGALGHASQLRQGDRIDVFTDHGVVRYQVTEVVPDKAFEQVAEEAQRIDDRHFPGGRLALITCWYDGARFTGNTFVFAQPL